MVMLRSVFPLNSDAITKNSRFMISWMNKVCLKLIDACDEEYFFSGLEIFNDFFSFPLILLNWLTATDHIFILTDFFLKKK